MLNDIKLIIHLYNALSIGMYQKYSQSESWIAVVYLTISHSYSVHPDILTQSIPVSVFNLFFVIGTKYLEICY
jgi:hypothetical protein